MSRDEEPTTADTPSDLSADAYQNLGGKIDKLKVAGSQPTVFGIVYPVSRACPTCGSEDHKKVDPKTLFAFTWDRVCKRCGTTYTPPMPSWGGVAFCAIGVVGLLLLSAVMVWIYHHPPVYLMAVLAWAVGFGIMSLSILYGIWSVRRGPGISLPPVGVAKEWTAALPHPVSEGKTARGAEGIAPAGPYSDTEPPG